MDSLEHQELRSLRRRLWIYRGALAILCAALLVVAKVRWRGPDGPARESTPPGIDPNSPHAAEIAETVQPLHYTFMHTLLQPDVHLSLDFKDGLWRLSNIHYFDSSGRVMLGDGHTGLCGDLTAYTYQKIKPIFESRYTIRFVRAAEANYFPSPLNVHYVLSIMDTAASPQIVYILDP